MYKRNGNFCLAIFWTFWTIGLLWIHQYLLYWLYGCISMHKTAWLHGHAPREEMAASQEMRPAAHDLRRTMTHLDMKQKLRWSQKVSGKKKRQRGWMIWNIMLSSERFLQQTVYSVFYIKYVFSSFFLCIFCRSVSVCKAGANICSAMFQKT